MHQLHQVRSETPSRLPHALDGIATARPGLVLLCAFLSGCAHHRESEESATRVFDARPPAFLTGPAGVLLTNPMGFSARVEAQSGNALDGRNTTAGTLLCSANKLVFVPEVDLAPVKHSRPGGFSFVWDVAKNNGYVLSEALQGYAPVVSKTAITNIRVRANAGPLQRSGAYTCEPQDATILMSDGASANFRVLRAAELRGFPVRISSLNNASPFLLTLSRIRLEPPSPALFAPPDGFSGYPSPEVLADELSARQHNLRRELREQR